MNRPTSLLSLALALAPAALGAGCGDDDDAEGSALPALGELPPGQWSVLEPGGDTTCSKGTAFRFFVWPGATDRLVVNFIGGGACWDDFTCSVETFTTSVEALEALVSANEFPGIFDMAEPQNPVFGYTHVVVPYCTGDVHWGDNVAQYTRFGGSETFEIRHKGAVNARAVLGWVRANVRAPERVLTTGCSAGAYGAAMWSAHVMQGYPGAHHVLLADSGAGVITDDFFANSFPRWNATEAFPQFIPGFDPDSVSELPGVYTAFAAQFPDAVFAQYNTVLDWNQTLFYDYMGGEGGVEGWSAGMRANLWEIESGAPGFRHFVAGDDPATDDVDESTVHCILNPDAGNPQFESRDEAFERTGRLFLELETDGVRFVDWLADLLDPAADAPDVACDGCGPAPR